MDSKSKLAIVQEHLRRWDPIGVLSDPSWPKDEYDGYAGKIVSMLDAEASREELTEHFRWIEETQMGLEYIPDGSGKIIAELRAIWNNLTIHGK